MMRKHFFATSVLVLSLIALVGCGTFAPTASTPVQSQKYGLNLYGYNFEADLSSGRLVLSSSNLPDAFVNALVKLAAGDNTYTIKDHEVVFDKLKSVDVLAAAGADKSGFNVSMFGMDLYVRPAGDSALIVTFPENPSDNTARAVYQAVDSMYPGYLKEGAWYIAGNAVLFETELPITDVQLENAVEEYNTDDEEVVTVTSEPSVTPAAVIVVPQEETPTAPQAPVSQPQVSPVAPVAPVAQPEVQAEPEPSEHFVSPGLIILIIVLGVVFVTCAVVLTRRLTKGKE